MLTGRDRNHIFDLVKAGVYETSISIGNNPTLSSKVLDKMTSEVFPSLISLTQ